MCGISGIISSIPFRAGIMGPMTDVIHHRGPDDEGYVLFEEFSGTSIIAGGKETSADSWGSNLPYSPREEIKAVAGKNVHIAFGHRRLSILDLSAFGHMPMCDASGKLWITYNGEIYNYKELRKELESCGYKFISHSDTEVILASYTQWGIKCLDRFNGMWAFAIYDLRTDEIVIARDRFGIKPLYYWFSPSGQFCFASEIKQFTTLPGWKAILNGQRAFDFLVYSLTDHTEETMFRQVYHIPAGHYFKSAAKNIKRTTKGKINTVKWYEIPTNEFTGSFEDSAAGFRESFRSAIRMHLRSDVPVGTALSGGLDSSAIVCEINRNLKEEGKESLQKTFSAGGSDERYDEKKWIEEVVKHTGVEEHYIYPSPNDIYKLTPKIAWHQDEPYTSQSIFLSYHVFELAGNNGVKVLLNGQGADEYLGGYGQFTFSRYAGMFKKLQWRRLFAEYGTANKYFPTPFWKTVQSVLYYLLPEKIQRVLSRISRHYSGIKKLIDLDVLKIKDIHPFAQIEEKNRTVKEISKHYLFYSTLPKFLRWEDRNSMAFSVESRVPFLDYKLVEFAFNLPDEYLDFEGVRKRVMRTGLADILPDIIANRKDKIGFTAAEEKWVKEDKTGIYRDKTIEAINRSGGIIKPEALDFFDQMINNKITFDYTYWRLILFSEWLKRFDVQIP